MCIRDSAISPTSGPISLYPNPFNFFIFVLVVGCYHILTFIAGAKIMSLSDAKTTVDAKSSLVP